MIHLTLAMNYEITYDDVTITGNLVFTEDKRTKTIYGVIPWEHIESVKRCKFSHSSLNGQCTCKLNVPNSCYMTNDGHEYIQQDITDTVARDMVNETIDPTITPFPDIVDNMYYGNLTVYGKVTLKSPGKTIVEGIISPDNKGTFKHIANVSKNTQNINYKLEWVPFNLPIIRVKAVNE